MAAVRDLRLKDQIGQGLVVDDFDLADCPVVAQRGDVNWSHAEFFSLIDIRLCRTGRFIIGLIPKNVPSVVRAG
jgi:hypothetical protein